jgi:hypothetical protein
MTWTDHPNITAILYAGAPGEQAGPSLVDVMWGTVNPSGRLPFSMDDVSVSCRLYSILFYVFVNLWLFTANHLLDLERELVSRSDSL